MSLPSGAMKYSSLPFGLQRGCVPPPAQTIHFPDFCEGGNGRTYTSNRPDSSEIYATERPSGENTPRRSANSVPANRNGLPPPESGYTQRSSAVDWPTCV